MSRIVAISTSSFGVYDSTPLDRLAEAGFEARLNPHGRKLTEREAAELLAGACGLIAGTEPLTREVLGGTSTLRAISRCGVGLDNVDLDAARELGIAVETTSDSHAPAVAELTLGGLLALMRGIGLADRGIRAGEWRKPMGRLLHGKTVGLVGLGRVGRALASRLQPFGVTLLAADPRQDEEAAADLRLEYRDLEDLLQASDVVSLHVPYSPTTHHLLGDSEIRRIKSGAYVVNCSRGGLIDETALAGALRSGHLAGAYLDTFEDEPYRGPLVEMDNVLLTSHIGSYAVESRVRMETEAASNLLALLGGTEREAGTT